MATLFRIRPIACTALLLFPACVVKLSDRNAPEENGGVTGAAANCGAMQVPPKGAPGGEARPKFMGRFVSPPEHADIKQTDWSGSYVTYRVTGTSKITAKLKVDTVEGKCGGAACAIVQDQMITIAVDGKAERRRVTVKNDASGKPTLEPLEDYEIDLGNSGEHEVIIHKDTEAQKGFLQFSEPDLHGGQYVPPTRRARRIEFIGDSIICGYGARGGNATCPFETKVRDVKQADGTPVKSATNKDLVINVPLTEDQYSSFTSQTARALDADFVTLCWSGKGVYQNYKESPDPQSNVLIPALYSRKQANFADPKWDFATDEKPEDKPQVVFISLGTNDFSRDNLPVTNDPDKLNGDGVPDGTVDVNKFYAAYSNLVDNVRANRPDAHIFLGTPPMVTDQFPIDNARKSLRDTLLRIVKDHDSKGDKKVYQMDLVEQGFRYGLGCDYHPNLEVHGIMAKQLTGAIRSKTCW
jgi:lysophospholipase L1-like esterase